jgi:hypothetical protein
MPEMMIESVAQFFCYFFSVQYNMRKKKMGTHFA